MKRVFGGTHSDYSVGLLTDDMDWLISDGWAINIYLNYAGLNSLSDTEACIATANYLIDYGLTVYLDIEQPFGHSGSVVDPTNLAEIPLQTPDIWSGADGACGWNNFNAANLPAMYALFNSVTGRYPTLWWNTPLSYYHDRFDECFELLDAVDFAGYGWEEGYDTGIQWLRSMTSKPLMQYIASAPPSGPGGGNMVPTSWYYFVNPLSERLNIVDAVMLEVYFDGDTQGGGNQFLAALGLIPTIQSEYPTMPIGVTTTYDSSTEWFGSYDPDVQKRSIATDLWQLKEAMAGGYLDTIETLIKMEPVSGIDTVQARTAFLDTLNMTTSVSQIDLKNIAYAT
jgi:hypothetical protein